MLILTVLLTGETGTGKEVFVRAIHGESRRVGKPFVAVNCGAIPAQLVESTLFGHEKGAFTGAVAKSAGRLREAEGGTIFLNEIGDLPLEAQVKILRVLQQKEVMPVGAAHPVPVNVRELENTLHRAMVIGEGERLEIGISAFPGAPAFVSAASAPASGIIPRPLAEIENEAIQNALTYFNGNVTQPAEAFGMAKSTLYRKLKN